MLNYNFKTSDFVLGVENTIIIIINKNAINMFYYLLIY